MTNSSKMTNFRWAICFMLFFAVVVNYLDRQVLSLTWVNFIAPEFHWGQDDYGLITGCFSLVYAFGMLFAGKFVDYVGTKRGFIIAIGLWSFGACAHAFCGILTNGIVTGNWLLSFNGARESIAAIGNAGTAITAVTTVSVWLFLAARCILSIGESGNFPCCIKAIAEYFPKKDRGFATGVFNAGAQIGALIAPFTIPLIARRFGWEMAFLVIGALGFIWMAIWVFVYKKPEQNPHVNAAELAYINQDAAEDDAAREEAAARETATESKTRKKGIASLLLPFKYRQTWAVIFGRFLPDSVWWFLLFWIPAFINNVHGHASDSPAGMLAIFLVYLISMLSLAGSYLPTFFVNRSKGNPYESRMRAMLIFALFPLLGLLCMKAGAVSMWFAVAIIGIMAAAHQSWSANVYNVVSDMFPKSMVATVTGAAGLASGLGSFLSNYGAGQLFVHCERTGLHFMGFSGEFAGYMIMFLIASFAYLFSWCMMKLLVPKYKLVVI